MMRRPPRSPLFPSTTLFRPPGGRAGAVREQPRRRRIAVIVDEDQLRRPRLSAEELAERREVRRQTVDRKSTRLNSSHLVISYAVFCLKKKSFNMKLNPLSPS